SAWVADNPAVQPKQDTPLRSRTRIAAEPSPAARAVLEKTLGLTDFRPGQADVVAATEAGADVLFVAPTGSGKSIAYWVPGIGGAIAACGRPPVGAFTATATPRVRHDIASSLGLREPVERVTGFVRDNLTMSVVRCRGGADKREALLARIRPVDGRSLVYCGTRKSAEEIASLLRAA